MRVFIATLIIIAAVVFIPFLAVKFYKWEMAREKRIFEAIKARHAEQHAFLDNLAQSMETNAKNWNQIQAGADILKARAEEAARIKRQRANQDKTALTKRG
jgi:biopolymer transport protein ExbB/TolQ